MWFWDTLVLGTLGTFGPLPPLPPPHTSSYLLLSSFGVVWYCFVLAFGTQLGADLRYPNGLWVANWTEKLSGGNGEANCSNGEAIELLDYNVSYGPFLSYEIEIGDGPEPELDNSLILARWTIYGPIRQLTVFIFKGVVVIFLQSIGNSLLTIFDNFSFRFC